MLKWLFKSDIQDFEVAELMCDSAILKTCSRSQMVHKAITLFYIINWKSLVILHPSIREFLRVN